MITSGELLRFSGEEDRYYSFPHLHPGKKYGRQGKQLLREEAAVAIQTRCPIILPKSSEL
jgi:hypothetical protein